MFTRLAGDIERQMQEARQSETVQYLPHFVAGSLPASDWESKILLVNLAGGPSSVTVDFFDNSGNPIVVSTNKGMNSSFVVTLSKPSSDSVSSDELVIFRNTGSFVTGWVKVRSTQLFSVDSEFKQFLPKVTSVESWLDIVEKIK